MNPRENMLSDIIIGAVEGGTGYWAYANAYDWYEDNEHPASVTLEEMEEPSRKIDLTIVAVENAMFRIAHDAAFSVNSRIRGEVLIALATNDAGDCDSDTADVIAQCACFGEVVYG